MKGSPKLPKSATSSPKLKTRMEQRKGSLSKIEVKNDEKKLNGITIDAENLGADIMKLASNQRRQKKISVESMAAVTIQKMWRGYRSRNLNKDTLRILHAIQAARARQHIHQGCKRELPRVLDNVGVDWTTEGPEVLTPGQSESDI